MTPRQAVEHGVSRRHVIATLVGIVMAAAADASPTTSPTTAPTTAPPASPLSPEQARRLRDWMTVLVHAQLEQGPSPRWRHRDCAGLVRFVVAEALREHSRAWKQAMGLLGKRLPPEIELSPAQAEAWRHAWRRQDGSRAAYVGALEMVQENTHWVAKNLAQAERGDLLFYDFGDEQHLMIWMGPYIAYHTGRQEPGDTGLRALRAADLMAWRDTRWRPSGDNPNFVGVYRLSMLAGAA
jgi:uncharacterized protein